MRKARRVLITGASSGIGEATAREFARDGHDLFLVARREERLAGLMEQCRQLGSPRAVYRCHDLSLPGRGEVIVRECLQELEGLDVLVCNAGYGILGPLEEVTPAEMVRIWQVNYQSAYESIFTALPHFRAQSSGHIVLVSSIVGRIGLPYSAAYSATKFAMVGLGEALRGELRDTGIGLSLLCPGYTATEFQKAAQRKGSVGGSRRPFRGQSAEAVARALLQAVYRNRREVHLTLPGKAILAVNRISPGLANWIMAKLARAERKGSRR